MTDEARVIAEELMPTWTNVEDALPETEGRYLVYDVTGNIVIGWYFKWARGFLAGGSLKAKYWMPLPEPPKEDT